MPKMRAASTRCLLSRTATEVVGPALTSFRSVTWRNAGTLAAVSLTSVKPTAVTVVPLAAPPMVVMTTAGSWAAVWLPYKHHYSLQTPSHSIHAP